MQLDDIDVEKINFTWGKAFKWFLIFMVAGFVMTLISSFFGVASTVATAPGKVITKTLNTDNIITSYEWFYDTNAAYDSRVSQVKQFKNLYISEVDSGEKSRLRIDMAAIQQTCRDLVTKYNANSEKMNKKIFKGWALPEKLIISTCEV